MSGVSVIAIPLTQYYPVFQAVKPLQNQYNIPPDIWGILNDSQTISIRQHTKILPKSCCSCPPCVKQENTYSVYAGATRDAQAEFLRIDEVSDDWNRCCCSPYHPLRLQARQFIPPPGSPAGSVSQQDWQNIYGDVMKDWSTFDYRRRAQWARDFYKNQPVLFSMLRDDGQRCCCKCPGKLLFSCVCCSFCADGMHVYAGDLQDNPEGEKGRPFNVNESNLIGSIQQPILGGIYHPELHLRDGIDSKEPFGKIEGPCFFGGWSELCFSFHFLTSKFGTDKPGDLAIITKVKPQSLAGMANELNGSNADNYQIEFNSGLTVNQKATVLAGQIFIDYMFFDGNTEKCVANDQGVTCYLCYCLLLGALCPCYIHIPKTN